MEVSQYSNQLLITSIGPVLDFETVKSRVDKQRATDVICSITLSIIGLLTTGKAWNYEWIIIHNA